MREWISGWDHRWVMRCDYRDDKGRQCPATSEAFDTQPSLDLFRARGWHIAKLFGDLCLKHATAASAAATRLEAHHDLAHREGP